MGSTSSLKQLDELVDEAHEVAQLHTNESREAAQMSSQSPYKPAVSKTPSDPTYETQPPPPTFTLGPRLPA